MVKFLVGVVTGIILAGLMLVILVFAAARLSERPPSMPDRTTLVLRLEGEAAPELEKLARDMGAFDFFEKPFPLPLLKKAVERALATPEHRKGPRGCCGQCVWQDPCARWVMEGAARIK